MSAITSSLWLASWFLAHGLTFRRATALHGGAHFRGNFFFEDPEGRAPILTQTFREATAVQRLITSRHVLIEVLDPVRSSGVCVAADVALALRLAEIPSDERACGSRTER